MARICTRCGVTTTTKTCADCADVLSQEAERARTEQRIARLLERRETLDAEIAQLVHTLDVTIGRRPRNVIPACGTETAYQRHKYRGEDCPAGDACKKAHAAHNRARDIARKVA